MITDQNCFWKKIVSVIIVSSGLPNPWGYLTELFWELGWVISVEEIPNQNCFGNNSVIVLCGMVDFLEVASFVRIST